MTIHTDRLATHILDLLASDGYHVTTESTATGHRATATRDGQMWSDSAVNPCDAAFELAAMLGWDFE
jgi:hypothetical protein